MSLPKLQLKELIYLIRGAYNHEDIDYLKQFGFDTLDETISWLKVNERYLSDIREQLRKDELDQAAMEN